MTGVVGALSQVSLASGQMLQNKDHIFCSRRTDLRELVFVRDTLKSCRVLGNLKLLMPCSILKSFLAKQGQIKFLIVC